MVLDFCFLGSLYTSLLALKHFRKCGEKSDKVLIITSSNAGLYPLPAAPLYAAAKHSSLGLARSMGQRVQRERIRVCALAPGLVPTGLASQDFVDKTDKSLITPVSQIVTTVNETLSSDKNTVVSEVSVDKIWYSEPPPFMDDAQRRVVTELVTAVCADNAKEKSEKKK